MKKEPKPCSTKGCVNTSRALGLCHTCYCRAWSERQGNKEKIKEAHQKWNKNNRDKSQEYQNIRRVVRPEKARAKDRRTALRKVFFTEQLVADLLEFQKGCCAICTRTMSVGRKPGPGQDYMSCDHDHVAKKPRGLLCSTCNKSLGFYEVRQRSAGLVLQPYEDYLSATPVDRMQG